RATRARAGPGPACAPAPRAGRGPATTSRRNGKRTSALSRVKKGHGRRTRPPDPAFLGGAGTREGHFDQGKTSGGRSSRDRLSDCVSSPRASLLRPPLPEVAVLRRKVLLLTV